MTEYFLLFAVTESQAIISQFKSVLFTVCFMLATQHLGVNLAGGKAMVAYGKPRQRRRGEGDKISLWILDLKNNRGN